MKTSPAKSLKAGASKKRSRSEAEDAGQSSSPPSTLRPNPAKEWKKAMLKTEDLLALVNSRFFREKETDLWHTTSGDPYLMEKNPDEIPMFARFVEGRLELPASEFLQPLNTNFVLHNLIEYLVKF
jgi:hypothetical protein